MNHTSAPSILTESRLTLRLAIPLIVGQISQMMFAVIDTVMVGHIGTTSLAALSFANALFGFPFIIGIGLLTSVTVLGASSYGKSDPETGQRICRQGLLLGLLFGLVFMLLTWAAFPLLPLLNQPQHVLELAPDYLFLILISLIPTLGAFGLKNYSDSLHKPWQGFWIFLSGVLINIPLNQLFIHGLGPIPALGLEGAGVATLISRSYILIAMVLWLRRSKALREWIPRRFFGEWHQATTRRLMRLGLPASAHLLAEVGAFSMAGFLVGLFGELPLAAHQIALTTAGTSFMIPLGLALALTVRMSHVAHASSLEHKLVIIRTGWILTLLVTSISCLTFLFAGHFIASLFVDDPIVIELAASLLVIAGLFQLTDGIQVASTSLLRGLEDVHVPARSAFVCYWIIGLPIGWWLAKSQNMAERGIWWGLAIGLGCAAIHLSWRLLNLVKQER